MENDQKYFQEYEMTRDMTYPTPLELASNHI